MGKVLIFMVLVALSACRPVTVQHTEGVVPVSFRVDDAAYWLEEWYWITGLPEGQQREILVDREREFQQSATSRNRIRLALLLAEGPASVRNQRRAQELLEGMDEEQTSQSGSALSALLQQVIAEHDWFSDELAAARSELEASESRIEELERQLQELTSIEQNIQQREIPQ